MGGVLTDSHFLEELASIFIQILDLSKMFMKQLKLTLAEDEKNELIAH